jgi:hypothetical protein
VQRAELITRQDRCLRGPRGFERVDYNRDDRVELGVDRFDAVQVCLGASKRRSAFVAARWRPRRQDSHVRAVDERFGRAANLLKPVFGEQLDRALTAEDAILGMHPLAYVSRG